MLYYLSDRARIIAEIRETKLNYYKVKVLYIKSTFNAVNLFLLIQYFTIIQGKPLNYIIS